MRVAELIEKLKQLPADLLVVVVYEAGYYEPHNAKTAYIVVAPAVRPATHVLLE